MQNKISVQSVQGDTAYKTVISNGRHEIVADEPVADGGLDSGPTPDELLVMALSACTSITLRMYAGRKGWNLGNIEVAVNMLRHEDGTQTFEREIRFEHAQDAATNERLLIVANKCPVHKTLSHANNITTSIE
jgi:putative redox protein